MHDELADIQGLQQKLAELDFEKEVLEARLQALTDSVGDPLVESAPSIDRVRGCLSVDVESGVFLGHRPQSPADQIDIYRQAVAALTSVLPLRRSGPVGDNDNTRTSAFSLADFFVDLETDLRGTESAKIVAPDAERQGGHSLFSPSVEYGEETAEDEGAPHQLSALEAAIRRRSQVLLGAPGSGKTTFLSFLANALALGDSEHLHGWPADERNHLPIFVILRDYDAWLGARGTTREANASLLWEFVLCDLRARNLDFVTISLSDALGRGEILLLLDGLDQVSFNLMPLVRDSIQDFRKQYVGCRILVTCRALAYEAPSMQLPGEFFPKTTLLPFDSRRVDRFIGNWFEQAVTDGQTTPSKAREKAKALRELVHRRNLRQRASNPMHLSVMALVYASRGELPDTRAGIYEEAIGTLLWHRDRDSRTGESGLKLSLREAGRSPNDLIGLLEQLSFEVCADGQATSGIADEERGLIAGIGEQDLISALCRLHPQKRLEWAQAVADTLKLRTGLFLERQPGALSYFHRSFHEYLAGARLAHHLDFPERAAALVEEGSVWDEVILFAVGFLVHNQREVERPLSLAHRLCPSQVPSDDLGWRKVWMSGEVLLEIGLSRVCDNKRRAGFLKLVRSRLAAIVERGMLRTRERARVGDVLGLLGDGRFHARRFHQPALFRGRRENALGLVAIAPGPFVMGSRESDRDRRSSEIGNPPEQSIDYRYWIARYPVTVSEYTVFVESRGYESAEWWTESGLQWLRERGRRMPNGWTEQSPFTNRPVVGLSWFEAMAYARWLDVHLRRRTNHIPADYQMRLPTEAEWEKVARGSDARRYAWGDTWKEGSANVAQCIGHPATVGMFPDGQTSSRAQDLNGNVWEWCLTRFEPYPYIRDDNRNSIDGGGMRALRGGSWLEGPAGVRCACRLGLDPDKSRRDLGFRLVLSVVNSIM